MSGAILAVSVMLVGFGLWAIARHDWLRLTRRSLSVQAEVVGHVSVRDDGQKYYSARFAFALDGRTIEVVDQRLDLQALPAIGTQVVLCYPVGRPDLARIPRPATWAAVYLAMTVLLVILLSAGLREIAV